MMHHLTDDLRVKSLAEIWRTLRPVGQIVIADMRRAEIGISIKISLNRLGSHLAIVVVLVV